MSHRDRKVFFFSPLPSTVKMVTVIKNGQIRAYKNTAGIDCSLDFMSGLKLRFICTL